MIIDQGSSTISVKLVFFGPAMSGKTTSIRWIFKSLDQEDSLSSIENTVGRTMFFDYGCIEYSLSEDWMMNVHIWAATGQDFYRSTRESVMIGADGIIFVADAQKDLLDENCLSWKELMGMFKEVQKQIPVLVCLNKVDLQNIVREGQLRIELGIPDDIQIIPTNANEGLNILVALKNLLHLAIQASMVAQVP